jgi:hypothetical protein
LKDYAYNIRQKFLAGAHRNLWTFIVARYQLARAKTRLWNIANQISDLSHEKRYADYWLANFKKKEAAATAHLIAAEVEVMRSRNVLLGRPWYGQ